MISKVFNIFNLIEYPVTKILYYPYNIKNKISKKINVPILAYHNICDPPENCEYPPYYVSILLFKKQMEFLYENGYSVISLEDFLLYSEGKKAINKNSVIITFDDGYKNIYEYAYPILKKYNFPATIFIVAGFIGNSEPFPWLKLNNNCNIKEWLPLSWEETLEMRQNVMSFGSHSMTHNQLSKLSEKEIVNEIKDSKLIIQSKLGSHCFLILSHVQKILKIRIL